MKDPSVKKQPYYKASDLWTLFLMSAFPTHLWTIFIVLSDVEWVSERTNFGDALGVGAYGLIIAAIESFFVFVLVTALGFLISRYWGRSTRVGLLSALIFLVAAWAIAEQLFLAPPIHVPDFMFNFLVSSGRPLRYLYIFSLIMASSTVLPVFYLILRFEKVQAILTEAIKRLSLLTTLYLVLDIAAVIIVVIRNR